VLTTLYRHGRALGYYTSTWYTPDDQCPRRGRSGQVKDVAHGAPAPAVRKFLGSGLDSIRQCGVYSNSIRIRARNMILDPKREIQSLETCS
jgi:hypothetical protein